MEFEKLGSFYLGRRVDTSQQALTEELVLYDSKDLTTHAVIVGMTGSGKTGLGIGLIEEAAIDRVPVIAIDPKGDLGNLLLTFPELRPQDFAPWVDARTALDAGQTVDELAAQTAARWKKGLADWGQGPERIGKLRTAADMQIFTPGSLAGRPLSVLGSLQAPPAEVLADPDVLREIVDSTCTGLLNLVGIAADPLVDREHILLATLLGRFWQEGRDLDFGALIAAIQQPEVSRIGVLDVDAFYPPKERFALSMRLNNLLASPSFQPWFEGEALDIGELLYAPNAHPRVSVMSIAHLDDSQRMFFVTMLLARLVAWMRRQPGTPSLRAVLYMDEVFGFMPPLENPPSKRLLLTLLKQARAHGIGVVLATQNPADLDYKGLSNAGTWFVGRLQTERDKLRLMEGLKGAAGGEGLTAAGLDSILSGLGKRRFLLHNVHESEPVVFETRWVMSYLRGPLTREQIRTLCRTEAAGPSSGPAAQPGPVADAALERPLIPPDMPQIFVAPPPRGVARRIVYEPRLYAAGSVSYTNARMGINEQRAFAFLVPIDAQAGDVDWSSGATPSIDSSRLGAEPEAGAGFAACPAAFSNPKSLSLWEKSLRRWLRQESPLLLYKSPMLKVMSRPDEDQRAFRIRLQALAKEQRDTDAAKLKQRYARSLQQLESRLRRAQHALEREQQQASGQTVDTVLSFGTALLGAVLGRKRLSTSSVSRIGTAMRKAGRSSKERGDVSRAQDTVEAVRAEMDELESQFEAELGALDERYDAETETLDEVRIEARPSDIYVERIALAWIGTAT